MFQATFGTSYHKLANEDDNQYETHNVPPRVAWHDAWHKLSFPAWILSICLWTTFLPLAFRYQRAAPQDAACSQRVSVWSPAFPSIEIVDTKIMNSFFHQSPYRGRPTKELEAAWEGLWNHGLIGIDDDKLPLLNKSGTRDWWRAKDGRVLASLEVFHDLHCLSFIRQYTYRHDFDYSYEQDFDGGEEMVREHADHCIESLRLKLQCTSDVTPYLEEVSPNSPRGGQVDFDTQHRCRDFGKIRDWYLHNTVSWEDM